MSNQRPAGEGRKRPATVRNHRNHTSAVIALACIAILLTGLLSGWGRRASGVEGAADPLRISEVMASNGGSLTLSDGSMPDWVELENTSDRSVNLLGYTLFTDAKPSRAFVFPGGMLGPGERVLVYCDDSNRLTAGTEYHAPFRLSAAGETIELLSRQCDVADAVTTPELKKDQVYCRGEDGQWAVSGRPTPGEANGAQSDPEEAQSAQRIEVVPGAAEITEVMARNVTYGGDDYIEIHNTTGAPLNMKGWSLSDSRQRLRRWTFPSADLPANGYLLIRCVGKDAASGEGLCANFKLSSNGEELYLTDPDGVTVASVTTPAMGADQAWSLTDAGWSDALPPSPGRPNDADGADAAANDILERNGHGVYITEVMAAPGEGDDWIELYNASAQAVNLSGFGLSNNAGRPRKWQFPEGTAIQPGQYLQVYADGTGSTGGGRADFRLSANGGYSVTLCDTNGAVFDRIYVPAQYQDVSYGRTGGFTALRYFETPTPGAPNAASGSLGRAPVPAYSTAGGLFTTGDTVTVEMTVPAGCQIYYTLDYTDPTRESTPYAGPITITGTTILRTRVYGDGYLESLMDTQSYLFDVNNGGGTIYVVSMVSDPYNLTSDEAGIMVKGPNAWEKFPYGALNKGANFWMDWEREVHIEVFNPDGSTMLSQECGAKLHGQHSRSQAQQSFEIIARKQYGDNRFRAKMFTSRPYTEYHAFLLRTGSQDMIRTHMRDEVLQQLARDTSVIYQEYEIAVMYLNGAYWGHYNLRERLDTATICQLEGWQGDEDALDLVKKNDVVMQGSDETMESLLKWLETRDPNTDEAYQAIDAVVDIENYLEYIALEIYTGNTDVQNSKRYRNPNADGKWRWALFDLDTGFDIDTNSVRRWLNPEGAGRGNATDNRLFVACMKNERIRAQFLKFLGDRMATTFTSEYVLDLIKDYRARVSPIVKDQLNRWSLSEADYIEEVSLLMDYARTRPARMLQFLKGAENLHLTREEMERYFGGAMALQGVTYDDIVAE